MAAGASGGSADVTAEPQMLLVTTPVCSGCVEGWECGGGAEGAGGTLASAMATAGASGSVDSDA